jgi:hypothetical protein
VFECGSGTVKNGMILFERERERERCVCGVERKRKGFLGYTE